MATKKYLSLERLTDYDELIKTEIAEGDASVKSYVDTEVAKKANTSHTHDDRYYQKSEVDTKLSAVNTSITNITSGTVVVKEAEHATSADSASTATTANSATKATQDGNGKVISSTYETKSDASAKLTEAKTYTDTVAAGKSNTTHKHDTLYDTKGAADTALASAKTYADNAATKVKNDLLNGAGTAYDTLKELGDLIEDNVDAIEALETVASGKADKTHSHAISEVTGLQSALDGKAASSHGTHVTYSTTAPAMDGTASAGSASTVARSDHKHPTDTTRAAKSDLDALANTVSGKADTGHKHAISDVTNLQSSLDAKQAIITGGATSIVSNNLTASRALVSDASGKVAVSAVTSTELGYLDGVTSAIQSQLDGKSASGHGHDAATTSASGFMTAAMVTKLNGIAEGANKTIVDTALSSSSTNPVQNKVIASSINTLVNTVSANTSSIEANISSINTLQTALNDITEITSEEIRRLFAN